MNAPTPAAHLAPEIAQREVPEALKPRRIAINAAPASRPQLVEQAAA